MLKRLPRNVVVLGIVSALNDMASEIAIRTIPLFLNKVLGVKTGLMGLIEGLAETTSTLLKLASGILPDKLGKRKPLTLFGVALSNLMKALLVDLAPPEFKGTAFGYFQVAVGAAALPSGWL